MKIATLTALHKAIQNDPRTISEHTHQILAEAQKTNQKYHHFCFIAEKHALEQAKKLEQSIKQDPQKSKTKRLLGIPLSLKDSIIAKGIESRAGSAILNGYIPLFNATVVEKSIQEGAIVIGKTSQDEFGFGSYSVNVGKGFEIPRNPLDEHRTCGGSSGGSGGYTTLTQFAHVSFAESTGGSATCPASFCGCSAITPTYGRLSRNGLIDYANSLDKISPMGKTIADCALLLEASAERDYQDSTSSEPSIEHYLQYYPRIATKHVGTPSQEKPVTTEPFTSFLNKPLKGMKIGIIQEFESEGIEKPVQQAFQHAITELEKQGAQLEHVSLPLNAEYSIPTYYLISTSEASTNLAKYCGMRYGATEPLQGNYNEYFSKVRSKHFGEEAKRRLLLGTFARMSGYRDAYYLRALKLRRKLLTEFQVAFKKANVLISPTMSSIAPTFTEIQQWSPLQHYYADRMVNPPNVSGLPHASVNVGTHHEMPIGLQLIANHWQEGKLVQVGNAIEQPLKGTK